MRDYEVQTPTSNMTSTFRDVTRDNPTGTLNIDSPFFCNAALYAPASPYDSMARGTLSNRFDQLANQPPSIEIGAPVIDLAASLQR